MNMIKQEILIFYMQRYDVNTGIAHKYFENCNYKFSEIQRFLGNESFEACSYDDFVQCFHKLLPIFTESSRVVQDRGIKNLNLQWLGSNLHFVEIALTALENEYDTVENILFLTSTLEYALGNVYYTQSEGRVPPHLLRDLLCTSEVEEVFGVDALQFLRILLGTPKAINLRNIVWHGFPKPKEIPQYYVDVLLLVIHSLGNMMQEKEFNLKMRPQIQSFECYLERFDDYFSQLAIPDEATKMGILSQCQWLNEEHKSFWKQIFYYNSRKQYWRLVVLILPQIELLLRLIYGQANAFDVSAKLDEYYITIDTLFEQNVPDGADNKKNKLLLLETQITEGALKCIYDLFISPYGPRLRDKVSHGEVAMEAIDNAQLCGILLHLSLNLLTANEREFPLANYESQFHLNSLTRRELVKAKCTLAILVQTHFRDQVKLQNPRSSDFLHESVKIFLRPRKEAELMNLILRNCQLIEQACTNYDEAIRERTTLLEQRKLHSKRRRTLEKMLIALQSICLSFEDVLNSMEKFYKRLQSDAESVCTCKEKHSKAVKFLKRTLEICENHAKYADKNSNEWIKSLELCEKFKILSSSEDIRISLC